MATTKTHGSYVLGLDIGMASVGAALLGDDHIIALHVRAFNKAETDDKGESLNKIRRESRLTRRRLRRRAHRLERARRLFHRQGLIKSAEPAGITSGQSPWALRAEGLDRKLEAHEWAATLYHIIKHRGFQSNRKSEVAEDEKAGQMLSGVSANQALLQKQGWRSIGEMVHRDPVFVISKRNKAGQYSHTFARSDLLSELGLLFAAQRTHGSGFAGADFEQATISILMARRPPLSGQALLEMLGRCTFEPDEFRTPKASHIAERFLWLTKLNNLRISYLGEQRSISDAERQVLIDQPFRKSKLTYKQTRKLLDLPPQARFNIIYRRKKDDDDELAAESATLFEAKAFHKLRLAYEKADLSQLWQRDVLDPQRLDQLAYAQSVFKDDHEARSYLEEHGVESEIIEAVLKVAFSEFIRLSAKALHKIIPHMAAGLRYDEAVQAAGYEHHSQIGKAEKSRKLPPISREDFRNPVVYRALNQARKLVNAIVDEYGSPQSVHIELARDLSKPFEERKRIKRDQDEFQKNKAKAKADFMDRFGCEPRRDHLTKWRLYREQDGKCPYSLKSLDIDRLFEDGYAEIDHALPYSRSFDNGMNNKLLVHTRENRDKGNRTPYEYLGGEEETEQWRLFQAFVQANPKYRKAKRDRLLRKNFDAEAADGFRERNLTDTRYACRAFKNLVETHLQLANSSDSKRCVVVAGQLTGYLRTRWGLLKVREDGDLHHALDAAVVAACSHSMVKRLSDYSRRDELELARGDYVDPTTGEVLDVSRLRKLDAEFPTPWPHFREELKARLSTNPEQQLERINGYAPEVAATVNAIRVSRAPLRRGTGQAHQETIRSAKNLEQGISSVRTPLEKIRLKDMDNIVGAHDPRNAELIRVLRQRLETNGDKPDKAFKEPVYRPSKPGKIAPQIRSVKLSTVQKSGTPVRHGIAKNGDMLRADIFTDGKKYYAVPLYVTDQVKPELPNRAIVAYKAEDQWILMDNRYHFIFTLYANDWLRITLKQQRIEGYYSSLDRSTGAVSVWTHDRNHSIGKDGLIRGVGIKTAVSLEKFHVDLLGRLYPADNETRQPLLA